MVISFAPPAIFGLGAFGGFEMQVLDQTGSGDIQTLASGTQSLIGASQQSPVVRGLFSGFTANDPQLAVDIDREKARSLGLPISEITNAMQIYLGSAYVNDFDFNNRAYRVTCRRTVRSGRTRRTWAALCADGQRRDGAAHERRARARQQAHR